MSDAKQPTITMYTTPTCGFCHMAKDYFDDNNVKFTQKDVTQDIDAQREMIAKSQQMGVPVIDIDGEIIVGFDKPKIEKLLKANA
ncbi:NrdH-redoxin [Candidatus Saccharibacteria bacterium]|nr:NrdH-redoxin [Candidatus Saccharibacteria bacterium]